MPIQDVLDKSKRILISGAGGGFDVYCGLPLYFALRNAGKEVHLANLSFAPVLQSTGRRIATSCVEVTADIVGNEFYFPELHLCRWLRGQGIEATIYAFDNTGVQPLRDAYDTVIELLNVDTVLLIDGGTDSLMRGDETGLGTPVEDLASLLALELATVPTKLLACVGFGVDAFHGICHAQFLEAVAEITKAGGYLGAWSLLQEMPEVKLYSEAVRFAAHKMPHHPSIVSTSIVSAIEGEFGDFHVTSRTSGSRLFINPLMSLLWFFEVEKVVARQLYPDKLRASWNRGTLAGYIQEYRDGIKPKRFEPLPM